MRNIKKIIIPGGKFKVDTVLTVATLNVLGNINVPIEKKYVLGTLDLSNWETINIGIGDVYDEEMLNFDYHQPNHREESASVLVLRYLFHENIISSDLASFLDDRIYHDVSVKTKGVSFNNYAFDFYETIEACSSFDSALSLCSGILNSYLKIAEKHGIKIPVYENVKKEIFYTTLQSN